MIDKVSTDWHDLLSIYQAVYVAPRTDPEVMHQAATEGFIGYGRETQKETFHTEGVGLFIVGASCPRRNCLESI